MTHPLPRPPPDDTMIPITMLVPATSWQRIQQAELSWDPGDLIGQLFDATVASVAAAVDDAETDQTTMFKTDDDQPDSLPNSGRPTDRG